MPTKRVYPKIGPFTKRRFKKKFMRYNKYRKQPFVTNQTPTAFPKTKTVNMRYVQTLEMKQGMLSVYDQRSFRANSIYDPYVPVDHKALGWDQWNVFYEKYVVLGSKIRCTITMNNSQSVVPVFAVYVSDTSNPNIVLTSYIENGGKYILLSPTTNGNAFQKTITCSYSAKKQHNITDIKDCESLESLFAANPTDQTYFNLVLAPWDGAASSNYVANVLVEIDYIVMLKDPKPLNKSL